MPLQVDYDLGFSVFGVAVQKFSALTRAILDRSYDRLCYARIEAAHMRQVDCVGVAYGVVMIASGPRSLVWDKTMAEDSLGLVLLQHRSFFDDRISSTRSEVFINQSSVLQFCGGHCVVLVRN